MSLEYSMFRFSDDYPTAESLSELVMQVCMGGNNQGDEHCRLIRSLVEAAHELRWIEAEEDAEDEDEVEVPAVREPGYLFMDKYAKACKKIGEPCDAGDAWWEDWWPTDCPWHPDDIARLARLKAGETRAVRRQLREEFLKHKEKCNEEAVNG
jgi:hypothetical protein